MKQLTKPELPKNPTIEDIEQYKSAFRKYDADRIAFGLASPKEVQRENTEWFIPQRLFSTAKIDWEYRYHARKG